MDLKPDSKAAAATIDVWLTPPELRCIRIDEVPLTDSSWENGLGDQQFSQFGHDEAVGIKAERHKQIHLRMPIFERPQRLAQDSEFPSIEVFNAARDLQQKNGCDALANLAPLDQKLLSNFEGYSVLDTNGDWYLANTLQRKNPIFCVAESLF